MGLGFSEECHGIFSSFSSLPPPPFPFSLVYILTKFSPKRICKIWVLFTIRPCKSGHTLHDLCTSQFFPHRVQWISLSHKCNLRLHPLHFRYHSDVCVTEQQNYKNNAHITIGSDELNPYCITWPSFYSFIYSAHFRKWRFPLSPDY